MIAHSLVKEDVVVRQLVLNRRWRWHGSGIVARYRECRIGQVL